VLTNTGATALNNIFYVRTVDPDNDETWSSDYTTINTITYQLPDPTNRVLVSATGTEYTNAYLGLGTKDCRAKCMIFNEGLVPSYTFAQMWAETPTPYYYTLGYTYTDDVGIALEFNIGTIGPGDSTTLSYAYILNAAYIDSALNTTELEYTVNNVIMPDTTDTVNLCTYPYDSISVNLINAGFYSWSWQPDSFITDTVGVSNIIHSDSLHSNITYTITGTNVAGGCNEVHYYLTLLHNTYPGPLDTSVTYCQFADAVALRPNGTGYTWWTVPTGGVGTGTVVPSTTVAGSTIYYVSQTEGLCESLRSPDTVTITPLPPPPTLYDPSPYCQGQAFVPFTVTGTGVLWYTADTGGVGSGTIPTINTGIPGTTEYWATQTVNGCTSFRDSISVTVLDSIIPAFTYVIHYGCDGDTVVFTNSSIGGSAYQWTFGDGTSDTNTNTTHIYYTQDTFDVQLTVYNGKCSDSVMQRIRLIHPLHASFIATPALVCQGSVVTFTNTSVDSNGTYMWFFGNGATATTTNATYTYLNTGVYNVMLIVTDFVPCRDTAYATISVDTISAISIALTDTVICEGTYITYTGTYQSIGNTGNIWNFGDGTTIENVNPVMHAFDAPGVFTITVTAEYRICPDTSATQVVTVIPQPGIYLGPDTSICTGSEPITLADNINAANPAASWLWNTGQTGSSITVVAPGIYYATVNINNCYASDTILVQSNCYMDIPNAFTPNGDGVNDYFFPRNMLTKGLATFSMNIYDRWGELIFQTTSIDGRGWDGRFNGIDQPNGVYVYVIDATFIDGQKEHHQGNITLLR